MSGHNDWYQISVDPPDIIFNPYPFRDLPIRQAALHTLRKITERYDNLYLGLSGGYDSEFIASVMIENDIPFTPLIFRDLYSRESDYAIHFCKKNGITPIIIEKNLVDPGFIKILTSISKKLPGKEVSASINVMLAIIAKKNNGYYLSGGGVSTSDNAYPNPAGDMTDFALPDFYNELYFRGQHPGAFFTYTPEIFYSYLKNVDVNLPTQEAKALLYELAFRPKIIPYHMKLLGVNNPEYTECYFGKGKFSDLIEEFEKHLIG